MRSRSMPATGSNAAAAPGVSGKLPAGIPAMSANRCVRRVRTVSENLEYGYPEQVNALGPVLIILGSALGAAVQTATGTAMSLRIPAFFAALVMVAVGLRMIMRFPETETEAPSGTMLPSSAVAEQATSRPSLTVPVLLMILSL